MSACFLGLTTLAPGNGGIGRVARMSIQALAPTVALRTVALLDAKPYPVAGQPVAACGNSKLAFAARCATAGLSHRHFLYDQAGLARAHPSWPGLRRRKAVWIHGREIWDAATLRPDYAAAVRSADLVLVNSRYTLERAERAMGPLPQARLCWLSTEQDEGVLGTDRGGPPTVFVLGRIDETESYKGHRELIAGWDRVVRAVPGARLVIAGGGAGLSVVREQAAASPAAASIDVLGFVPEAEIPGLWARAHVFAMPSRGEGFGLVYIEAMRHGLPVIASVHDAGQEVNVDGQTGYNVSLDRPDAPNALVDRVVALLSDEGLRRRLGEAGRRRWQEHFRFSAFRDRFLPIVQPFLAS